MKNIKDAKNSMGREGGEHARVEVAPFTLACLSLAHVACMPYIFHAFAMQGILSL